MFFVDTVTHAQEVNRNRTVRTVIIIVITPRVMRPAPCCEVQTVREVANANGDAIWMLGGVQGQYPRPPLALPADRPGGDPLG